jgi:hypothetical protein
MDSSNRKRRHITTLIFGVLSISSYIFLFTHQEWVVRNFTRGGVYAVYPIMTAFYFSFVHGFFTSGLLDLFGMRAATKKTAAPSQAKGSTKEEVQP